MEYYYEDTRTVFDMFQRGLRIAGGAKGMSIGFFCFRDTLEMGDIICLLKYFYPLFRFCNGITFEPRRLSCVPQETARVWASESRGSPTSGSPTPRLDTCFSVWILEYSHCSFVVWYAADRGSATLQVFEQAQLLGSGLLAKGCQPNSQQFVGIFAQNRPEVWPECDVC